MADLNFCDSVVGGLTSAFLSGADGIVDLAGDVAVDVSSPADLAGDVGVSFRTDLAGDFTVKSVVPSRPCWGVIIAVAPSAVAEVASSVDFAQAASSADFVGGVTVGVMSSAVSEVVSLADISGDVNFLVCRLRPLLGRRPRPTLLRHRPRLILLETSLSV